MPKAERNIAKSDSKKADKTGGRSKKTRAKAKNVTQTVIVNVGKRGGSKAPSIPRPTPLQQALQLVQATRQPAQGESLVQSTQILQRMLEPINRQLQALMRPRGSELVSSPFPQAPVVAPEAPMVAPMVAPAQGIKPFVPFELPQTPVSYTDYVLDLPDAPLVQPPKPLLPAGPLRLDPEYEDVPRGSELVSLQSVPFPQAEAKEEEMAAVAAPSMNYDELLEDIDSSVAAEGNKKRLPGQYTKAELIQMVTSVTGRTFSPSMSNSYERIKQIAISFIKSLMRSK